MYALRLLLTTLLTLTAFISATPVVVPVAPRQLGSLACNIARIKILADLASVGNAADKIADPAVQNATQTGLDQANGGIKAIAAAIFSGETAPPEARTEVKDGLAAMTKALAGNATDKAVADAQEAVTKATAAGQEVVTECK